MAWYLATGRSPSRWMSLPTPLTVNYGTDAYTIEFELAMTSTADSQFVIGQTTNSSITSIYMTQYSRFQIQNGGSNVFFTNPGFGLFDGNFHKYRIEHDVGGAWRAYRDDVLFQTGSYTASTPIATPLNALFRGSSTSSTSLFNIKYIEVTGFGSGSARWDATLSGGTGTVLPAVSGTNNATQSGTWPADNSEWVFYSSGTTDYSDTLSGATFTSSGNSLAAIRGYGSTLNGATYSTSGNTLAVTRGYSSVLNSATFTSSGGSLSATRGYSSSLNGGSYSYSGNILTSTFSGAAQSFEDSMLGGVYSSLGNALGSFVGMYSVMLGANYTSADGSLGSNVSYSSLLNGGIYTSAGNRLISTWSGEVTVTIEGYTIRFAEDSISAKFHADDVSATFDNDHVSVTWRH